MSWFLLSRYCGKHCNDNDIMRLVAENERGRARVELTTATRVVLLTALCFMGSLLGQQAAFRSGTMPLIWPPAGIALAAILLFGFRFWPGAMLGALIFSLMDGMPAGSLIIGTALGSTVGAVGSAYLLKKVVGFDNRLDRTRDVVGFFGVACLLGASVNAVFGLVSGTLGMGLGIRQGFSALIEWWVPNVLAALVVTPVLLAWGSRSRLRWDAHLTLEAVVCGVGLLVATLISFYAGVEAGSQGYPLEYVPFPFLVWAALRFGQRGATTGTLLVSALAFHSQLSGRGPFAPGSGREGLMLMGSYIGLVAVTNLLLAAGCGGAAASRDGPRGERESAAGGG